MFMDELVQQTKDWSATLLIGVLVASWWRGTWVILDIWLCDQPDNAGLTTGDSFCFVGILEDYYLEQHKTTGWHSIIMGVVFTFVGVGMMWAGLWRPQVVGITTKVQVTAKTAVLRFLIVWLLAIGALNWWRGVWYLTDFYLFPNKYLGENKWGVWPLGSFWTSSVIGSSICFLLQAGPSLLAPPGIFLLDGPGVNPPPIAVTVVSSYYSLTIPAGEKIPRVTNPAIIVLDLLASFIAIPFFVVWFWRGSWLVMDYYLWEFSPEKSDVWKSIGWSTIMALVLMIATSETAFSFIHIPNQFVLGMVGRLRTYLLAWGVVNFWRAVWYIWDELAGTTEWSCWVCHLVPLALLGAMGCMNCILAPASTLGMDFVPHPDCADEPLFSNLPVPADDLYVCALARDPIVLEEELLPKEALETKKSFIRSSIVEFSAVLDVDDFMSAEQKKKKDMYKSGELELPPINEDVTTTEPVNASSGSETSGPKPVDVEAGAVDEMEGGTKNKADEDAALAEFAAEISAAKSHDIDVEEEEAEMAAAWAKMEAQLGGANGASKGVMNSATQAWGSGGTGRRGSYSSVRTKAEAAEHRSSYLDMQRPDLDRRVGHRSSVTASQRRGSTTNARGSMRGSTTGRRTSDLFRNR